ncbi:uncharacterized protein LOC116917793 [Daphnia magna]|uniref:Uncharacterized protein n=1 Tax=Daphnia magna TaxID=35525 RepID=A0A164NKA5_9CRUS|nr:uncharacterized protein LOC116917793 [Daphnia magna]KZS06029.1 Uncharacterized protein APZ42_030536 [Daphnia magna]
MDNAPTVESRKRHLSEGEDISGQQDTRRVRSLLEVADHGLNPHRTAYQAAPGGQQGPGALAVALVRPFACEETSRLHRPPSPPESDCSSDNSDEEDDSEDDEIGHGDATLAGYEYCSKEAIRYLMEEEKLNADHPVIQQLQQHLDSRRSHVASNPGPSSNNVIP